MTDPREVYGRIVRETWVAWAREQYRPKPSWLLPWEEIDRGRREADMRIGYAVANYALTENAATWGISCTSCAAHLDRASAERERAERAEAMLAGARSTVTAFLGHYGNSTAASFQQALDLAHGVLQVLDRAPLEAQERGGGEAGGS